MARRVVGLDIGTSAIRAVELTVNDGARPSLEAFGQVGLPVGAVVEGEVRDRSVVARALERLWRDGGFTEKRVLIGIAGLRAITRELDMPTLPPSELDNAVRFKADDVVPFPLERTSISPQVIAQYADAEGAPTLRVLLAAAHRDLVDSVVGAVMEAGLDPVGIDLNTAALVRALHDPSFTEGPEAIVSVGAGLTLVVVHQQGVLQFVRTIDLGGASITQSIGGALDLPIADAEEVKRRLGDTAAGADPRARSAAAQAVDDLVVEVHNSIRFFSSLPGRSPVARVLVTGAGARAAGFLPRLQQGLDVPVTPASPLSMIDTSRLPISAEQAAAINPILAVPVGLGLPDPSGRQFNLLPPEIARKAEERRIRRALVMAAVLVVIVLAALSVWRILGVRHAQDQVAAARADIANIKNVQIPKYDKAVSLRNAVTSLQANVKPALAGEVDVLVVLNQLAQYQPTSATLSTLTITAQPPASTSSGSTGPTTLGTVQATVSVPDLQSVTAWGESLSKSPAVTDIVPSGLPVSPGLVSFSAQMDLTSSVAGQRAAQYLEPLP